MSLNFSGIGASVSVKDDGATDFTKHFSDGLDKAASKMDALGDRGRASKIEASQEGITHGFTSMLGSVLALATGVPVIGKLLDAMGAGKIAGAVMQIGHLANAGQQLTTDFEATSQAISASTRKVLGQAGLMGKELDKANGQAAGMAMGMKISEKTAGDAVASMAQFGAELKAFGINSAVTGAKLEDGLNIPIRDLAMNARRMKTEFGANDKQLSEVAKTLTGVGEIVHDMKGPFEALPQMMELASKRANLVARGLSDIGGTESIKAVSRAQAALYQLGLDSKTAQMGAISLESKMTEAMEGFGNMFAGTEADLHPLLSSYAIISGDVEQAFKNAKKGPDVMIKSLAAAVQKLKAEHGDVGSFLNMLQGQLGKVDANMASALVGALKNVTKEKLETINTTKVVGKDLTKVANDVWRSTLTLDESFKMAMGAGMATFRNLGRSAAVDFVHKSVTAFGEFNKWAADTVKTGGPLGAVVQKMSEMSSLGVKALLPKTWQPAVAVFGQLYDSLGPSLDAMGKMQQAVSGLLNPWTLLSAAVGGFIALIYSNKAPGNTWADAFNASLDTVKKYATEWTQKILNWADTFPWETVFKTLADGLKGAIQGLTSVLNGIGTDLDLPKAVGEGVTGQNGEANKTFAEVGAHISKAFHDAFDSIDWGALLNGLWEALKGAYEREKPKVMAFFHNIFGEGSLWDEVTKEVSDKAEQMLGAVLDRIAKSVSIADKFGGVITSLIGTGFATAVGGAANLFGGKDKAPSALLGIDMAATEKVIGAAIENVKSMLKKNLIDSVTEGVTKAFTDAFKTIMDKTTVFLDDQTKGFKMLTDNIYKAFQSMWVAILEDIDEATKATKTTIKGALGDLQQLKIALEEVRSAKQAVNNSGQDVKTAAEFKPTGDLTEVIAKQSAWPDWYTDASGGFSTQFQRGVADIVAAVAANKVQVVAGNTAGARDDIRGRLAPSLRDSTGPNTNAPPQR